MAVSHMKMACRNPNSCTNVNELTSSVTAIKDKDSNYGIASRTVWDQMDSALYFYPTLDGNYDTSCFVMNVANALIYLVRRAKRFLIENVHWSMDYLKRSPASH